MFRLKKISIQNFLAIRRCEFEFHENGLNLIHGRIGSGKSSLADAIIWCLYGKPRRDLPLDKTVNRSAGKNLAVALEFSVFSKNYMLIRYRKHDEYDKQIMLSVDGEEFIVVEQEDVDNIIGIPYDLINVSNFINSQSEASRLLELKSARNPVFGTVIGLSGISDSEKRINPAIKQIREYIDEITGQIIEKRSKCDSLKSAVNDFHKRKDENIEKINNRIRLINKEMVDFTPSVIKKAEKQERYLDELYESLKLEKIRLENSRNEMYEAKKAALLLIKECRVYSKNLRRFKTGVCPMCRQDLKGDSKSHIKISQKDLDEKLEEYKNLKLQYEASKIKLQSLHMNKIIIEKRIAEGELNKPGVSASEMIRQKEEAKNKIANLENLKKELEYGSFISQKNKEIKALENELPDLLNKEKVAKEELKYWEFWKEAFDIKIPGNIKTWRIGKIIDEFNAHLRLFTHLFFKDDQISDVKIRFNTDLTEQIFVDGQEAPYASMSRGQRQKLNSAVNFGFFSLVRKYVTSFPFLFVDEAMDGLDDESQHAIMDYLQKLGRENVIYIISHNDAMKNSVDRIFHVKMENKQTVIEQVLK